MQFVADSAPLLLFFHGWKCQNEEWEDRLKYCWTSEQGFYHTEWKFSELDDHAESGRSRNHLWEVGRVTHQRRLHSLRARRHIPAVWRRQWDSILRQWHHVYSNVLEAWAGPKQVQKSTRMSVYHIPCSDGQFEFHDLISRYWKGYQIV